jgi:cytochrome c peroxidase
MRNSFFAGLAFLLLFIGCKHDPEVTPNPPSPTPQPGFDSTKLTPYALKAPAFFPPIEIPGDNQPYVERIQLGRRLYYDPILSNDGRSCSQCHIQARGFTSDHISAEGLTVMPHVNLAWNDNWLWNGGYPGPMEDKIMFFEVHDFFQADITKINADTTYRRLFKQTYGVDQISLKDITYALAQFIRTMISQNSRFYQSVTGKIRLTQDEEAGRLIFFSEKGDCFHCHAQPLLSDNDFHNTGLNSDFSNPTNQGHYHVTGNPQDMGRFRTANLHNVALRRHFMHDGRFKTLEEVVNFYNDPPKPSATLDPIMTKGTKMQSGLGLSELEKFQLVQFLRTFTDTTYLNNPAFSKPQ